MGHSGEVSRQLWRVMHACILLLFCVALSSCASLASAVAPDPTPTPIRQPDGNIPVAITGEGKLKNAIVQLSNSSQVDGEDQGGLRIQRCESENQLVLAWAENHEVGFIKCDNQSSYTIFLPKIIPSQNSNYSWASANDACQRCHSDQGGYGYNEFNEWAKSNHAKVFTLDNQRYFETMYLGTNLNSKSGQLTEINVINNEMIRRPPAYSFDNPGPGFKLDFPTKAGNCAYCHAPALIISEGTNPDLMGLFPKPAGVIGEGITCDVCHKALSMTLDEQGYPLPDRPGMLSFDYLRSDTQPYFTGPFANIKTIGENPQHRLVCSSIFAQSEFCAACHYGNFSGTLIYNSYGEWKNSKYGDKPEESDYKTCQDCHMSHIDANATMPPFSEREGCTEGATKFEGFNPVVGFDHNLMNFGWDDKTGNEIPRLIVGAAKLDVGFKYEPEKRNDLGVVAKVTNTKAGHRFPTDSPLRHLILVVEVTDQQKTPLIQTNEGKIPNWGGIGIEPNGMKNYGGKPGKIFANLLVEDDTNISPTAAYWNPTKLAQVDSENKITSDTRLWPDQADESTYYFSIPTEGDVIISVKLIYRYAFIDLAYNKGWVRPDIVVASMECEGPPTQPENMVCKTTVP